MSRYNTQATAWFDLIITKNIGRVYTCAGFPTLLGSGMGAGFKYGITIRRVSRFGSRDGVRGSSSLCASRRPCALAERGRNPRHWRRCDLEGHRIALSSGPRATTCRREKGLPFHTLPPAKEPSREFARPREERCRHAWWRVTT